MNFRHLFWVNINLTFVDKFKYIGLIIMPRPLGGALSDDAV